jgi:hypothetical protein
MSLAAASICLVGLAWALRSSLPSALIGIIGFLLAVGLIGCLMVTCGGLMCLWRDAREAAGKEDLLVHCSSRLPRPGPPPQLGLRFLLGSRLRPGDYVRVRPRHEIETTLDGQKTMAGLPFMAEMEPYCGGIFQVHRRVNHINDMRNKTGLRRLQDVVTLTEVRCSGSAHDGCEAECQILWKDAWLRRLHTRQRVGATQRQAETAFACCQIASPETVERTYSCQMTALWEASQPMSQIDIKQDLQALIVGNVDTAGFLVVILTRIFNIVQQLRGGAGYPYMPTYPSKGQSPTTNISFDRGDAVVIRTKDEIAGTLVNGRNKGLWFDRDMVRFCGRPAIVRRRVNRIIHEATGKMVVMKTPCLTLEGVVATGEFLKLCPQQEYIFWREVWLTRSTTEKRTALASN